MMNLRGTGKLPSACELDELLDLCGTRLLATLITPRAPMLISESVSEYRR